MRFRSLSFRLRSLTMLWVLVAMISITLTLLLSWRLEGGAAAINDVGSLRMQSYRLALLIQDGDPADKILQKIDYFDVTLRNIEKGDPSRPLFLPDTDIVRERMTSLQQNWQRIIKPMYLAALAHKQPVNNAALQQFVTSIDGLVFSVEAVNARYTQWLRAFQSGLLALVLISAAFMVVLLYSWVIKPLEDLQQGVSEILIGNLGVQVPRNTSTEFAQVDDGFNQMSARLKQLYTHLEQEVEDKTRDLADKNFTLGKLYDFSNILNQAQTATEATEGFLSKIMAIIPAQAGSIRLIDFQRQRMDLIAHSGLPEDLQTNEACQRLEACFCGRSVQNNDWQPISFHDHTGQSVLDSTWCERSGFQYLQVFQIRYNGQDLGMMTLFFKESNEFTPAITELLDTLCNQLGVVVSNMRLADESQQLAVLQERNLIAQGLHDSIAQTLTFLNLQVQMLESALVLGKQEQINENLQFIKDGVKESYEDVRELLLNFRTKISRKEFTEAVETLIERFENQTQIATTVSWQGNGPSLSTEQQLQFIFILQESLSNIRKHANAQQVNIDFDNQGDFVMIIRDNGIGLDLYSLAELPPSHVGLSIMRERASRISAKLDLDSQLGEYTQIKVTLPQHERSLG